MRVHRCSRHIGPHLDENDRSLKPIFVCGRLFFFKICLVLILKDIFQLNS